MRANTEIETHPAKVTPRTEPAHASLGNPQWARYLTAVGAATAAGSTAQATIIYFNPADTTLAIGIHRYVDFSTGTFTAGTAGLHVYNVVSDESSLSFSAGGQVTGVAKAGTYAFTYLEVSRFSLGQSIGSSGGAAGFASSISYMETNDSPVFPWNSGANGTTGYIGVKLSLGGQTKYGWVGVIYNDVANTIVLTDFAYENTANTAILAGAVPEPGSALLLAMGAAGVAAQRRRKLAA